MEKDMKKTVIRIASSLLCLILALSMLVSCDLFGKKIDKSEIPQKAIYEFSGVQNLEVENSEFLESRKDSLVRSYTSDHYVHYYDNMTMFEKIDTVLCQDGEITFTHYYGKGSPSFTSSGNIYSEYGTNVHTLGTYSGEDVTIDAAVEENEYFKDAYLTGDTFIICVEETDSEGVVITYELVFTFLE